MTTIDAGYQIAMGLKHSIPVVVLLVVILGGILYLILTKFTNKEVKQNDN